MKKIVVLVVAVFALGFAANAQDALGLRFGGGSSYGAELSYQKGMGGNRMEFDLGMRLKSESNFFYLAGVYQWQGQITDWLGWFAGPGVKVSYCVNHGVGLALAGQAGLEANFADFPFQFTLDIRPEYEFILPAGCVNNFGWGLALGIRYKLN
ncbi:MAG: hypothetical protein IKH33_10450 [Bacteroidales bacterium]|nr:hypothetical protein [Bacteroidales bacterium]MBR6991813.1 hypothetical protein [Bacteroidales bacterium]